MSFEAEPGSVLMLQNTVAVQTGSYRKCSVLRICMSLCWLPELVLVHRSSHKSWHQVYTSSGKCVLLGGPALSSARGHMGGGTTAVGGGFCTTLWLYHHPRC